MNAKDLEQVVVFRRYLLERAGQSRSRLVKDQVRRWVARLDTARNDNKGRKAGSNEGNSAA